MTETKTTGNLKRDFGNVAMNEMVNQKEIDKLREENERLQDIVNDYRSDFDKVLSERCPTDEVHCGCVPILRKQLSDYQNALVLITTFPSSKQQTFAEHQMQIVANDALDYRSSQKIAAAEYWVEKVRYLEGELQLAVDKRNEMVSAYTQQIMDLEEELRMKDAAK